MWCVGCWALWNDRNALSHGKEIPTVEVKAKWVGNYLHEFLSVSVCCNPRTGLSVSQQDLVLGWVCPPQGWVRMNTDASCSASRHLIGFGVVVRTSSNRLYVAQMEVYPVVLSPLIAEARVVLVGLRLVSVWVCCALRLNPTA